MAINKALGGLPVAGKNLSECGFAGAVSTDKAYFVALIDPKIHPVHQDSRSNANLKVAHANHLLLQGGLVVANQKRPTKSQPTNQAGLSEIKSEIDCRLGDLARRADSRLLMGSG
jgi:hypothetical protein